ncbi:MAG: hypothetical protein NTX72_05330 [Candidatus Uhrbacteria bacterium]|nr:hypothetical protein [Candidatus Uhrbacteria bacterium]
MKKLWFKAKQYGWGWYPATWQGWLVLLGFLVLDFGNVFRLDVKHGSSPAVAREFFIETIILVIVLIWICYRTGEKPRWSWGVKK